MNLGQALKHVAKTYPGAMVQNNAHEPEYPLDIVAELDDDDNGRDYMVHTYAIYELDERGYVIYAPVYKILHPKIFTAEQLIEVVKADQDDESDTQATRLALEDGEYIGQLMVKYGPISQELVEQAYTIVENA